MTKAQQRALRIRLHRINMQASQLEVKAPKPVIQSEFSQDVDSSGSMFGIFGGGKKKAQVGGSGSYMV